MKCHVTFHYHELPVIAENLRTAAENFIIQGILCCRLKIGLSSAYLSVVIVVVDGEPKPYMLKTFFTFLIIVEVVEDLSACTNLGAFVQFVNFLSNLHRAGRLW